MTTKQPVLSRCTYANPENESDRIWKEHLKVSRKELEEKFEQDRKNTEYFVGETIIIRRIKYDK